MYKINETKEAIIQNLKSKFNSDNYEIIVKDDYTSYCYIDIRTRIFKLAIFMQEHIDFSSDNIISTYKADRNKKYITLTISDLLGNKICLSNNYVNEITGIIESTNEKMDKCFEFIHDALFCEKFSHYDDSVHWEFNERWHFFLKFKEKFLWFRPILSINNDKIIVAVFKPDFHMNEPVFTFNINDNIDIIYNKILFFV